MTDKNQGTTRSGKPITDELVDELNQKAEEGFDVDEITRRGERPPMGSAAATVESVRLDPELSAAPAPAPRTKAEPTPT